MNMRRLRLVDQDYAGYGPDRPMKGGTMRVAFATHDRQRVDAHFGSAKTVLVYDVGPHEHTFLEAVQFDDATSEQGYHQDDGDDRMQGKVAALEGCSLLFVLAIGGPAAARVVRARVHPVKLNQPEPITAVIERVQTMLNSNPPPWLRKAMSASAGPERFLDDEP
jgi:nitrogen fixation protein NifX